MRENDCSSDYSRTDPKPSPDKRSESMKRHWVKLWVDPWLDGTSRFQMTGAQRAFWIDLLAMAGRSRFPGIVCSGKDDAYVGYPLTTFAALDPGAELDIQATFDLFVATGKITLEVTAEKPVRLLKVTITNWAKYQSEYQRQKPYQETYRRNGKRLSKELTPELSPGLTTNYLLEGEVRSETEKENQKKTTPAPESGASDPLPAWLPLEAWNAFLEMRKKKRCPLTQYAVKLAIKRLAEFREQGDDPKAVLEQSVLNGYQGLFEIKPSFATRAEIDRAQRNADASVGKYYPNRKPREQTAEEKEEARRTEIEVGLWERLEKGTLEVNPETVAWVKGKQQRLGKIPAADPRPRWIRQFLELSETTREAVTI
jgi:hypothetical protein